jgi:hypothetical protein
VCFIGVARLARLGAVRLNRRPQAGLGGSDDPMSRQKESKLNQSRHEYTEF